MGCSSSKADGAPIATDDDGFSSAKADGAKAPIATHDDGCSSSAKAPIDGSSPEEAPETPAAPTDYDAADSEGLTEHKRIAFRIQRSGTDILDHTPSSKDGPAFACSSVCGRRPQQEDAHVAARPLLSKDDEHLHMFGVFDGHGGQSCSKFVEEHLPPAICKAVDAIWDDKDESSTQNALRSAFREVDSAFLASVGDSDEEVGSTAVVVILEGQRLHCAWAGDSRAILCRADGVVDQLSQDHKPNRPDEKERIQSAGGCVYYNRVNGVLGVSRAFGDKVLKQWVPADPELVTLPLSPGDDFLVLACDGLWDVADNETVAELVRKHTAAAGLRKAACALTTYAIRRGSSDNVTCMIVQLEAGS